ncbi:hypothetical protein D3C86_1004910 [compost metagenome]
MTIGMRTEKALAGIILLSNLKFKPSTAVVLSLLILMPISRSCGAAFPIILAVNQSVSWSVISGFAGKE